jgi:hypothetical protein
MEEDNDHVMYGKSYFTVVYSMFYSIILLLTLTSFRIAVASRGTEIPEYKSIQNSPKYHQSKRFTCYKLL